MCVCNLVEVLSFLFLMANIITEMNSEMGDFEFNWTLVVKIKNQEKL